MKIARRQPASRPPRPVRPKGLPTALVLALMLLAIVGPGSGVDRVAFAADETPTAAAEPAASDPSPEPAAPVDPAPTDAADANLPTDTPTPPESIPTDTPGTTPDVELSPTPTETPEGTASATSTDTPTPTETPTPQPAMAYTAHPRPVCRFADPTTDTVASGGFLDYACTAETRLTGSRVDLAAVRLDWTVAAAVDGAWGVQLLPPADAATPSPAWTEPDKPAATFAHGAPLVDAPSDAVGAFDTVQTVAFGLRVHRPACALEPHPITLDVAVQPSAPGLNPVPAVVSPEIDAQPFSLNPTLAPIPEPTLAFGGALDFGRLAVDAMGVQTPPQPQTLTLTVGGLDLACGNRALRLKATDLGGQDGSTIGAGSLFVVSVDGAPPTPAACPLDGGCAIATVAAGPASAAAATFTIGVSLVLPDRLHATTFDATLTASLAAAP